MRYILSTLLLVMSINLNADDFDKGVYTYEKGSYQEAVSWYKKSAEQCSTNAEYKLALVYNVGKGVL